MPSDTHFPDSAGSPGSQSSSEDVTGHLAGPELGNDMGMDLSPDITSGISDVLGANMIGGNMQEVSLREQPCNIDAEQSLLGAILLSNEAYHKVSSVLRSDHFYDPLHEKIFEAIEQLIADGRVADPITLKPRFETDPAMAEIGGVAYLGNLAGSAVSIINVMDYAQAIFDMSVRRGLIQAGEEMVNEAYDANAEAAPREQIETAEQTLYQLAESGKFERGFKIFLETLGDSIDMIAMAYKRDSRLAGLSTGITDLDYKLGGLQPSDLIIVAGRPGMGKSALSCNVAFNIAKAFTTETDENGDETITDGAAVGIFSLEMSAEQLATRLLAEESGVPSSNMRRGQIDDDEFRRIKDTAATLERIPLFIDDTGGISIAALTARARRLKRNHNIGALIVDYIQLVTPSGNSRTDNRVQEISQITQGLKALAKELNIPVIALSQLSRAVENRDDKRPQLSDLRESGSIEQDADVVMFVYREEYYVQNAKPAEDDLDAMDKWQEKMERCHGRAEVIVGKQRHGPTGTVALAFQPEITKFSDLAPEDRYTDDNFN